MLYGTHKNRRNFWWRNTSLAIVRMLFCSKCLLPREGREKQDPRSEAATRIVPNQFKLLGRECITVAEAEYSKGIKNRPGPTSNLLLTDSKRSMIYYYVRMLGYILTWFQGRCSGWRRNEEWFWYCCWLKFCKTTLSCQFRRAYEDYVNKVYKQFYRRVSAFGGVICSGMLERPICWIQRREIR